MYSSAVYVTPSSANAALYGSQTAEYIITIVIAISLALQKGAAG